MKKLLITITLSALVGTSASNLKPMFANNVINHGFKSNQINQKDISIQNENDINPFVPKQLINGILNNVSITSVSTAPNGTIYAGSSTTGLWKSTDGVTFEQVTGLSNDVSITSIAITPNGTIYVGTNSHSLWKSTDSNHFEQVAVKSFVDSITSIAVAPDGTVWVGIEGFGVTIYNSTDGINFKLVITSKISNPPNCIDISKDGTVWVGLGSGLWKSTDGINFNKIINKIINSIAITPNGTIYVGTNSHSLWKSTDGVTFEQVTGIPNDVSITSVSTAPNGTIYAGSSTTGLWKSTDGVTFTAMTGTTGEIKSLTTDKNNNVYAGTDNKGLWIINPINLLLNVNKPNTFDKSWPLYNGIVYSSKQKIDIKDNLVASATLDGKSITVPTTNLDIPVGEHNLILTLKDKRLATVFGGNESTGQVTYKLWIKTSIDKNKIDYQTKIDDTQLYTGLISNGGNTNMKDIIQTKIKDGTGTHNASINVSLNDTLIDFDVNKSFYEQGTVDETTNNFTATGSKQKITKNLSIQTDGIYHLYLEDTVGNKYDSYLELGESNWKLKGTFDDSELDKLKSKLNVTVNLTDPNQKSKALGWLHQYENFVDKIFEETIKTNGKGFDSEIKNQITSYTAFLKPLTYDIANEPKFDDGLDKTALVKIISDKANEILNKGLNELPKNLNIDTRNVVNKSTLDNYSTWIKNYQDFINKNKDKWINDIEKIASRGFATTEQENNIKAQVSQFLNNDNIKNYLKNVVWKDNKLLKATSSDYNQFIELDKLQSDTINWVNTNMKDINIAYQQAIKNAESGLNLHGYSIDDILNGKQKPQTKNEIDNFVAGQSYHDWLQSQANIKFRGWGLLLGFSIGIPLILLSVVAGIFIRWRTNPKYRGYWRARQLDKQDKVAEMKKRKNIRKENKGIKKNHDE